MFVQQHGDAPPADAAPTMADAIARFDEEAGAPLNSRGCKAILVHPCIIIAWVMLHIKQKQTGEYEMVFPSWSTRKDLVVLS